MHLRKPSSWLLLAVLGVAAGARAQTAPPPMPAPVPSAGRGVLRIHVISTQNTYLALPYDIFSTSGQVVGSGKGADESMGEQPQPWELKRQRIRPLAGSIEYSRPSKASSKTLP